MAHFFDVFFAKGDQSPDLPPDIPALRRRLELTQRELSPSHQKPIPNMTRYHMVQSYPPNSAHMQVYTLGGSLGLASRTLDQIYEGLRNEPAPKTVSFRGQEWGVWGRGRGGAEAVLGTSRKPGDLFSRPGLGWGARRRQRQRQRAVLGTSRKQGQLKHRGRAERHGIRKLQYHQCKRVIDCKKKMRSIVRPRTRVIKHKME